MKTLITLLALTSIGFFWGCATPTQTQALATAEIGNSFATYVLNQEGVSAVKYLQDIAANLPQIPYGKVSPTELGVINAEFQKVQNAQPSTSQLYSQVGSAISLVSQSAATAGGNPTAEQGVLSANLGDLSAGITNAIAFWQGQQTISPTVPVAPIK